MEADDNDCTQDACVANTCANVPIPNCGGECDDAADCFDDNACTLDQCFNGSCFNTPIAPCCLNDSECGDGDVCTQDVCGPDNLCANLPIPNCGGDCDDGADCNDNDPCTLDQCVPDVGCQYAAQTFSCDDGDPCTLDDKCEDGACTGGPPLSCKDDNPCTQDACHPEQGCVFPFNEAPCSDGDPCSLGDKCAFGSCHSGPFLTLCTDNNPCTTDVCDPLTGGCVYTPNNLAQCTDGDPCTLGDFCESGACTPGGASIDCDDSNPCTDDKCGADGNCVFLHNFLECDDDDPCTVGDDCSDGLCQAGTKTLYCGDDNPCTDDFCDPGQGCKHTYNNLPCNDGNACTVGDVCIFGQCTNGNTLAACDDGNPCTDDACLGTKGCVNAPNTAICSDDDPCTQSDQCTMGICVGEVGECDDGNQCTKEICLAGGGCEHIPLLTPECRPAINFINPPRGAMLVGPQPVFVTGWVDIPEGGLKDFFINAIPVEVNPVSGAFSYMMEPEVGLNVIHAITNSNLGGEDKAIRSFAYTTEYHPLGTQVPEGLGLWLSQMVWDDNNTSDIDDIATVITLLLESFDLAGMIPNPLTQSKAGWCDLTVTAAPVFIGNPSVDLHTKNQALGVTVTYPNLFVGLDADLDGFLCPSVSGDVSADFIQVSLDLILNDNPAGIDMQIANSKVNISGLDIDLDGILGFLFNWLIDLFEGTIANQMEAMVLDQLGVIDETLADALNALAITQSFELPPLVGDGPPTTLTLATNLTAADFDQFGGFLEMSSTMSAQGGNGVPYETKGSLGRAKCLQETDFFDYLMQAELEIALKDDMLNQMLHAAWYSGAFEIPLPQSILGDVDLQEYGVVINDLSLSFLLPPIISSCNFEEQMWLGLGDIKVNVSLLLFDNPLELTAFASARIAAEMAVVEDPVDGPTLGIELGEIVTFDIEVEELNAGFEGAQAAVEELLLQFLGPDIFTNLAGDSLGGIPIPEIPLDGFTDAVPKGTTLSLDLKKVYRLGGRSVLAGNAK